MVTIKHIIALIYLFNTNLKYRFDVLNCLYYQKKYHEKEKIHTRTKWWRC